MPLAFPLKCSGLEDNEQYDSVTLRNKASCQTREVIVLHIWIVEMERRVTDYQTKHLILRQTWQCVEAVYGS
ncbi:unnamed protein product [Litomosoides sigmodontis]|uniref:Uncharacterized protein n=1 Tax=Litomosoides sigmodontis TaxID=42156 RepID=A0A3P6TEH2_LITSI|nr:unnamed protein product [Litomosoides sigmodontis]